MRWRAGVQAVENPPDVGGRLLPALDGFIERPRWHPAGRGHVLDAMRDDGLSQPIVAEHLRILIGERALTLIGQFLQDLIGLLARVDLIDHDDVLALQHTPRPRVRRFGLRVIEVVPQALVGTGLTSPAGWGLLLATSGDFMLAIDSAARHSDLQPYSL